MIEYPTQSVQAEKRIGVSGNGYIVRVTQEAAVLGLNPGDMVLVQLTVIKRENKDDGKNE